MNNKTDKFLHELSMLSNKYGIVLYGSIFLDYNDKTIENIKYHKKAEYYYVDDSTEK